MLTPTAEAQIFGSNKRHLSSARSLAPSQRACILRLPSRQASPWHLFRLFCASCLSPLSSSSLSFGELSHVTSLCRSAWSAATAPFTSFHSNQKHFHIFFASFWKDLWSFIDLTQLDHWRGVQVIPRLTLPHRGRLSPLPPLARVPQATAAPQPVRLLLVGPSGFLIMLPTSLVLTKNSSGDARLKTAGACCVGGGLLGGDSLFTP